MKKKVSFIDALPKIASIITPLIIAVIGWKINATIMNREINSKYVKLAIDILKSPPDRTDTTLRRWAINVLEKFSPVEMQDYPSLERKMIQNTLINDQLNTLEDRK